MWISAKIIGSKTCVCGMVVQGRKTRCSLQEWTYFWKCGSQSRKSSSVIYPDAEQVIFPNPSLRLRRLKMNIRGTYCPEAEKAQKVVVWPLSPLVIAPTCFWPFLAIIFPGMYTVAIPVSLETELLVQAFQVIEETINLMFIECGHPI